MSRRRIVFAHINAEILTERGKSAAETRPDRIEFPIALVSIDLPNHDRRFDRELFAEIESNKLLTRTLVDHSDISVLDHAEILPTSFSIIDRRSEIDLLNVIGHQAQVNVDLLNVTRASRRAVAAVFDRPALVLKIAVEHKVLVAFDLAVGFEQEGSSVQIDPLSRLPTQPDQHPIEQRIVFRQIDLLSFR